MKLIEKEKEDLIYRIANIDFYLQRKESNLMSIVWADWNIIKTRIQKLLFEEEINDKV